MKNDSSSILWEQDTCRGIPLVRERSLRLSECCEHMEHPSGLSVLLLPKPTVTTYAMLIVRYGAGDRHFRLGEREITLPDGVAHFLEHKLFARPDGSDVNELFSAQGAEANAWTDYDRTAYLFSTAEPADGPLATLVDFVFTPHFTPRKCRTRARHHQRGDRHGGG